MLLVWLLLVLRVLCETNSTENDTSSDFLSFDQWKKLKLKNETSYKNMSQSSYVLDQTNRFNYASIDCAAKVITTNDDAKGSNSILIENKDSYLINRCSTSNKFVVVELCQDILIDLIELGNFEFFSSNFKKIRLSVNERYESNNWKSLGEFTALNDRNLQKFKILNPLIWAKYLKIELLSHYGNEFYCPISLVRVYGKTMLEDFKEETIKASEPIDDENDDECKVETLPYLELNKFLNNFAEYCEADDEMMSTSFPSTQDSIYKNIIKRLSLLESNASLSLLYIEEQSKLLSNSFLKLESNQINNFNNLIQSFNNTINEQVLRINQFNQFKLFESNKVISHLASDLSFYKKLIILNFLVLLIILVYIMLTKDFIIEDYNSKPSKNINNFEVGSVKKKYRKRSKYRI